MYLHTIKPGKGAKKVAKRLGRGIGSGLGKTCGRGHKGQHARAGGYHKVGFEGGQMPLQRRLPKFGFSSKKSLVTEEVRLSDLQRIDGNVVNLNTLKDAGLINKNIKHAKIFLSGNVTKVLQISGVRVTQGAKAAIEAVGGEII